MAGVIVIGGPTGSGKSALALRLAEALNGAVINADSMQLYRDLRVVTARPTPADEARLPHHLYGILAAEQASSVGRWLDLAEAAIKEVHAGGQAAIVVGGTGLYLHALLHGIAPVPEVPQSVRDEVTARYDRLGGRAFHAEFVQQDQKMGLRLLPTDRQRLIRAAEVLQATGQSLALWQDRPAKRVDLPAPVASFVLTPPRAALHRRIEQRLQAMIEAGALSEVDALRRRGLSPELPLMKAVTVPELLAHLAGRSDLGQTLTRALAKTRQYAKRQLTWFRHQMPDLVRIEQFGDAPGAMPDLVRLRRLLLTDQPLQHSVRPAQQSG